MATRTKTARTGRLAAQTAEQARVARRRALGAAIRAARGSRTQTELGRLLGSVPQTTISRWEAGMVDLTCEQVLEIERALNLHLGTLHAAAGYIETEFTPRDVESILRSDPSVHPELRADAVRAYKSYVQISRKHLGVRARTR